MSTIILIGSPKGNMESSGSYFLAQAFNSKLKEPCEIRSIIKENRQELIERISQFDNIILITPNYIHSIPGTTLDFLYQLPPAKGKQALGFIIQAGYPESSESEIMCRFFKKLTERLGYSYLGSIAKGECAGIAIMPDKFGKMAEQFAAFGALFEQKNCFDKTYCEEFAKPYTLSKSQMFLMNLSSPIGNALGWHKIMKQNNAYQNRKDMPFLD